MTQAIVCGNREGLALASDSLIVQELDGGRTERLTECKLFPLGTHAAVVSVGAAIGAELCAQLSEWLAPRHLEDFDDVLVVSRDFLAERLARHLRTHTAWPAEHSAATRHLYFIIGGYAARQAASPAVAVMLQSEAGELPFQETRLGHVFTLPRRLALEGRVTRQIAEGVSLRALAASCRAGLAGVAERNGESVGGPFDVATITRAGVEFLEDTGLPLLDDEDEDEGEQ